MLLLCFVCGQGYFKLHGLFACFVPEKGARPAWFFPFLGTIFIYRNTLQGLGDGLVPMLGGVFELAARALLVSLLAPVYGFVGICLCDPGAWIAALIPLVPVYMHRMRKLTRTMNANA